MPEAGAPLALSGFLLNSSPASCYSVLCSPPAEKPALTVPAPVEGLLAGSFMPWSWSALGTGAFASEFMCSQSLGGPGLLEVG